MTKCLAGIVAAVIVATSAHAASPVPPGFLVNPVYQGRIGGLEAWSSPHADGVFLVLPEATLRGADTALRRGQRLVIGGSLFVDSPPEGLASTMRRSFVKDAAQEIITADAMREDVERKMATLQSAMKEASREFRSLGEAGRGRQEPGAGASTAPSTPDRMLAGPDPERAAQALELLEDAEDNGFWFGLGEPNAPTVYAFIDPACPFCAEAVKTLGPEIARRELQLRVALAPVISEGSRSLIAAILAEQDVPTAFLQHEYGTRTLPPGDWNALPVQIREGVENNVSIMKAHGLQGVPVFVYRTTEGAEAFFGAPPGPDQFTGALPAS